MTRRTSALAREYFAIRAKHPGMDARNAMCHARGMVKQKKQTLLDLAYGAPVTVKLARGFSARVELHYEESPDYSCVGEFNALRRGDYNREAVDRFGRDMDRFILSDDRGHVCEFIPAQTFAEVLKYYREHYGRTGYARAVEQRKSEVKEAREVLRGDRSQYWLSVAVSLHGVELGSASLGGIDVSDSRDPYLTECARELIGEALKKAHATRAKLCCKSH